MDQMVSKVKPVGLVYIGIKNKIKLKYANFYLKTREDKYSKICC